MAKRTYQTLKAELDEANDYIAELEEKLEDIAGLALGDDDADEDQDDEEDDVSVS